MHLDMRAVILMDHVVNVHYEVKIYECQNKNNDEHNFCEALVDKKGFVHSISSAWMAILGITKDAADYLLEEENVVIGTVGNHTLY
jgi:hypothetical protein